MISKAFVDISGRFEEYLKVRAAMSEILGSVSSAKTREIIHCNPDTGSMAIFGILSLPSPHTLLINCILQ